MSKEIIEFIKSLYDESGTISLHEPVFNGNEKKYITDCIDSTFVSSIGKYVDLFEENICELTNSSYAVAVVNGTSALHIALKVCGVNTNDLVLTQALSFVATSNAITYCGANPIFIDVDLETLGLSPDSLSDFLQTQTQIRNDGFCYHKSTGKKISACVPMHTFGFPCKIESLVHICNEYNIPLIEDAAEAVGSLYKGKHVGTFGKCGTYSFNGNKIITSGGGGVILTNDVNIARQAKHLTTVAKVPHQWKFEHDEIGYNFRMPNINAALACAQIEQLDQFIAFKRKLAKKYHDFFETIPEVKVIKEPDNSRSNYWLNTILFSGEIQKETFLHEANKSGIMARPAWELLSSLSFYKNCLKSQLPNSHLVYDRLVSLPSSVSIK